MEIINGFVELERVYFNTITKEFLYPKVLIQFNRIIGIEECIDSDLTKYGDKLTRINTEDEFIVVRYDYEQFKKRMMSERHAALYN